MKLDEPEILDEFLQEQTDYNASFKALVLRLYVEQGEDIAKTAKLSGISEGTLRNWLSCWNQTQSERKKKV